MIRTLSISLALLLTIASETVGTKLLIKTIALYHTAIFSHTASAIAKLLALHQAHFLGGIAGMFLLLPFAGAITYLNFID